MITIFIVVVIDFTEYFLFFFYLFYDTPTYTLHIIGLHGSQRTSIII